jgi:hypothetical protein
MRFLVCGGRDFADPKRLDDALDEVRLAYENDDVVLIHGYAPGADYLAMKYAYRYNWTAEGYRADWDKYGRAAGPIRNQRMLEEGKPDFIVAFPGGRGTADMVSRARKAGVEVREK